MTFRRRRRKSSKEPSNRSSSAVVAASNTHLRIPSTNSEPDMTRPMVDQSTRSNVSDDWLETDRPTPTMTTVPLSRPERVPSHTTNSSSGASCSSVDSKYQIAIPTTTRRQPSQQSSQQPQHPHLDAMEYLCHCGASKTTTEAKHLLETLAAELYGNLDIKDRKYHLKTHRHCFVAEHAVEYMVDHGMALTRIGAVELGRALQLAGWIDHVKSEQVFKDGYYFFRFLDPDDNDHDSPTNTKQKKGGKSYYSKSSRRIRRMMLEPNKHRDMDDDDDNNSGFHFPFTIEIQPDSMEGGEEEDSQIPPPQHVQQLHVDSDIGDSDLESATTNNTEPHDDDEDDLGGFESTLRDKSASQPQHQHQHQQQSMMDDTDHQVRRPFRRRPSLDTPLAVPRRPSNELPNKPNNTMMIPPQPLLSEEDLKDDLEDEEFQVPLSMGSSKASLEHGPASSHSSHSSSHHRFQPVPSFADDDDDEDEEDYEEPVKPPMALSRGVTVPVNGSVPTMALSRGMTVPVHFSAAVVPTGPLREGGRMPRRKSLDSAPTFVSRQDSSRDLGISLEDLEDDKEEVDVEEEVPLENGKNSELEVSVPSSTKRGGGNRRHHRRNNSWDEPYQSPPLRRQKSLDISPTVATRRSSNQVEREEEHNNNNNNDESIFQSPPLRRQKSLDIAPTSAARRRSNDMPEDDQSFQSPPLRRQKSLDIAPTSAQRRSSTHMPENDDSFQSPPLRRQKSLDISPTLAQRRSSNHMPENDESFQSPPLRRQKSLDISPAVAQRRSSTHMPENDESFQSPPLRRQKSLDIAPTSAARRSSTYTTTDTQNSILPISPMEDTHDAGDTSSPQYQSPPALRRQKSLDVAPASVQRTKSDKSSLFDEQELLNSESDPLDATTTDDDDSSPPQRWNSSSEVVAPSVSRRKSKAQQQLDMEEEDEVQSKPSVVSNPLFPHGDYMAMLQKLQTSSPFSASSLLSQSSSQNSGRSARRHSWDDVCGQPVEEDPPLQKPRMVRRKSLDVAPSYIPRRDSHKSLLDLVSSDTSGKETLTPKTPPEQEHRSKRTNADILMSMMSPDLSSPGTNPAARHKSVSDWQEMASPPNNLMTTTGLVIHNEVGSVRSEDTPRSVVQQDRDRLFSPCGSKDKIPKLTQREHNSSQYLNYSEAEDDADEFAEDNSSRHLDVSEGEDYADELTEQDDGKEDRVEPKPAQREHKSSKYSNYSDGNSSKFSNNSEGEDDAEEFVEKNDDAKRKHMEDESSVESSLKDEHYQLYDDDDDDDEIVVADPLSPLPAMT